MLRRCAVMQSRQALDAPHKYTLQAFNMVYGVHCWPRVATWYAPHVFSVWWLRKRMLEDVPPMTDIEFLDTRADVRRPPLVLDAAWHFTSTGAPRELQRKLTTWGHANMFLESSHPGSLDLRRLERSQRFCLEARGAGMRGTPAPRCADRAAAAPAAPGGRGGGGGGDPRRDRRLPGVLLNEATLRRATLPEYLLAHRAEHPSLFRYLGASPLGQQRHIAHSRDVNRTRG